MSRSDQRALDSIVTSYKTVAADEYELDDTKSSHESPSPSRRTSSKQAVFAALRRPLPSSVPVNSSLPRWIWKHAWQDVRAVPWRASWNVFFAHILPPAVLPVLLWLIYFLLTRGIGHVNQTFSACAYDGSFNLDYYASYSPWPVSQTFSINLNFGTLTFNHAKLIDVAWDILAGRGVQAILATITYAVFTRVLSQTMETEHVSYRVYEAISLQNNTITGVTKLVKDCFSRQTARLRLTIIWMILCAAFVLVFPSLLSAMTGYSAIIAPFVNTNDTTLVPVQNFRTVYYVIHDGSRLNNVSNTNMFYDDYPVTGANDDSGALPNLVDYSQEIYEMGQYKDDPASYQSYSWGYTGSCAREGLALVKTPSQAAGDEPIEPACNFLWEISNYTSIYGFLAKNQTETVLTMNTTSWTLPSPSLNISAYFSFSGLDGVPDRFDLVKRFNASITPYGYAWQDPDTGNYTFGQVSTSLFTYNNTLWDIYMIAGNGTCQPIGHYTWGFSFLLLFICLLLTTIWSISMYALYLHTWLNSTLDANKRDIGQERAVLDLASAMSAQVDGMSVDFHSNSELQSLVKGGKITYKTIPAQCLSNQTRWTRFQDWRRRFQFWKWAWAEVHWLVLLILLTLLVTILPSRAMDLGPQIGAILVVIPWIGVFLVLAIGRKVRNRWVAFFISMVMFCIFELAFGLAAPAIENQVYYGGYY